MIKHGKREFVRAVTANAVAFRSSRFHACSIVAASQSVLRRFGVLLSLAIGAGSALADQKCAYPDIVGAVLVRPENRLGEVRMSLQPPDYGSALSIQRHLLFSGIWGRLVRTELRLRTQGKCAALTTSGLFPDLRAFLSVGQPSATIAARTLCVTALADILADFQPSQTEVENAGREEAAAIAFESANPREPVLRATNVLTKALSHIYDAGSVMHALVSLDTSRHLPIDIDVFRRWLEQQQLAGLPHLNELQLCPAATAPQQAFEPAGSDPFPYSGTIPPGRLKLSVHARVPNALRRVVVVGLNAPQSPLAGVNTPVAVPAMTKYCNQERRFSSEQSEIAAHVRCLAEIRHGKNWLMFFCDPKDCSERATDIIAESIAADADVMSLARDNSEKGQPKGPYVVEFAIE